MLPRECWRYHVLQKKKRRKEDRLKCTLYGKMKWEEENQKRGEKEEDDKERGKEEKCGAIGGRKKERKEGRKGRR